MLLARERDERSDEQGTTSGFLRGFFVDEAFAGSGGGHAKDVTGLFKGLESSFLERTELEHGPTADARAMPRA